MKITRKIIRERKKSVNVLEEIMIIINQYFPYLKNDFKNLTDIRNKCYTTYELDIALLTKILALTSGIQSQKGITDNFNTDEAISNFNNILNTNYEELPHHNTLDDIIKNLSYDELEVIQTKMIKTLIKGKLLDKYRFKDKYFLIVIDGTMLFSTNKDLGKHAITQTFYKGQENEITVYGYYVLEAKLVCGDLVFSFASEFIENSNMTREIDKQDCELKAAYRLLNKIKKRFPKLPIIISGDALYASKKFMEFASSLKFEYLIRYKEGSMPTIMEEWNNINKMTIDKYSFVNELGFGSGTKITEGSTNVISLKENDKTFMFITSIHITKNNMRDIVTFGRRRWKIENQGFKDQKKGVLNIEHITSKDFLFTRNNYLLIQFAHTLLTLLNHGNVLIKSLRETKKGISDILKTSLTHFSIPLNLNKIIQLRLP